MLKPAKSPLGLRKKEFKEWNGPVICYPTINSFNLLWIGKLPLILKLAGP